MSLMSSSLLLQQYPACLIWIVCVIGGKWSHSCFLLGASSGICSRQQAASLCSSHLAFSLRVTLTSKWCSHTVALTRLQLGRIFGLSYQRDQIFIWFDNLSIADHAFPMGILTALSVDKILLPRYVNESTNFKALSFSVNLSPSCLKNMDSVLSVHIKANNSLCLF